MGKLHMRDSIVDIVTSFRKPFFSLENYLEQSFAYPVALSRRNSNCEEAAACESQNEISIKEVSCKIGQDKILDRINMRFLPKKKYLVLGDQDSGVDALLSILTKNIQSYEGTVTINKNNLKKLSTNKLSKALSLISKETLTVGGSVSQNTQLKENYNAEIIRESLGKVGIFTKDEGDPRMESNYNIEEDGKRLSVARALMNHSSILILDETSSSERNESDFEVEEMILNMREMTVLTISHRLSKSLMGKYDRIFVMENGSIVEEGSFSELLLNHDRFYRSYVSSEI